MQNLRTLAKQWLPPVVSHTLEASLDKRKHRKFSSYDAALAYCSKDGYENDVLIDTLTYKMARYRESLASNPIPTINPTQAYTLLSLTQLMASQTTQKAFRILDFGGGLGGHYLDAKGLLGETITLKWAVVETPAMAKAGQQFQNDELHFFDNIDAAIQFLGEADLLHTSGTLQCVDKPYQYLRRLMDINARLMCFNRLGLNRLNRDVITIHHSKLSWNGFPGLPAGVEDRIIRYPFTFLSEADFLQQLRGGYRILAKFDENSGIFPIHGEEIIGLGLLVEKNGGQYF